MSKDANSLVRVKVTTEFRDGIKIHVVYIMKRNYYEYNYGQSITYRQKSELIPFRWFELWGVPYYLFWMLISIKTNRKSIIHIMQPQKITVGIISIILSIVSILLVVVGLYKLF